ncbi:hypothetical protein Tco_1393942 [Tanacetum coccineum]
MAARMASVVDGVGDGGGMMRRWCGCGDEVRGGCDDGDDDESGGVMAAAVESFTHSKHDEQQFESLDTSEFVEELELVEE